MKEPFYKEFETAYTVAFILLLVLAMVTSAIFTAYWIVKNRPVCEVRCVDGVERII
jgi:hypothetical protein